MSERKARELFSRAQELRTALNQAGWLGTGDTPALQTASPVDLFEAEERPLVVGLFGGTGVGKSSLLNRLAGADIARTGVVRPTSMEITAYLHSNIQLEALPEHFASDRFSDNRHNIDRFSNVMWVDMPDFDSAEIENREQVLQWLPHIDLLIYVVTPERYKDAEGWKMMLENGYRHAWMFVMNQWDRADPVQYDDFIRLLGSAGFTAPQVFKTVCVAEHAEDEFTSILDLIESLAHRNVVSYLQQRGWIQRISAMKTVLSAETEVLQKAGSRGVDASLAGAFEAFEKAAALHLDAPFKTHSNLFQQDKTHPVLTALKSFGSASTEKDVANSIAVRTGTDELWDEWSSVRLEDTFKRLQLAEDEHGIPKTVMASVQNNNAQQISDLMTRCFEAAINKALEGPGTMWWRTLLTWLKLIAPILAVVRISYRVVDGFIGGAGDRSAYVGMDFLVNGLLLVGLAWLIPMIIEKVLTPSVPDAVYRSLHEALREGIEEIRLSYQKEITLIKSQRSEYQTSYAKLEQDLGNFVSSTEPTDHPALQKLLLSSQAS